MAISLEYLRSRAQELSRSSDVLDDQAKTFFTGRKVRVLPSYWNAEQLDPKSKHNLTGKVLEVTDARYWGGQVWLKASIGKDSYSISLEHVELVLEKTFA